MVYAKMDSKTRITLTREVADEYGEEFEIVRAKGELILIPYAKDPLKALQQEGKKIPKDLTSEDLRKIVNEELEKRADHLIKKISKKV